jgi:AcrR family transcriptional regulator
MVNNPGHGVVGRKRNAVATREAILQSAVERFAGAGYDGVGVREIAEGAGVTAMLVNRYFGSKELLFTEVVDLSFAPQAVRVDGLESILGDAARQLVSRTAPHSDVLNPFLLLVRSASCPRAVEIIRTSMQEHGEGFFAPLIDDPERAMVANALIAGIWLLRKVVAVEPLVQAPPEVLAQHIERMLAALFIPGS